MIAAAGALAICVLAGSFPGFIPPPGGTGDEILPLNPRSFAMGGVSAGLSDPVRFSLLNPAGSGWATSSGIFIAGRYAESDDAAWNHDLGFPSVSLQVPLPWGLTLTGAIAGRSRLTDEAVIVLPEYRGSYQWSGGLEESYAGISLRTTDWLAVSLGGRCTFGNILADVTLAPFDPGPPIPINTVYRDDASFRQAWGAQVGLMVNAPGFSAGLSVVTDREGTVDVLRDFSSQESDSLTERYQIPGELAAGITVRPLHWLLVGLDVYSRKTLNLLGSRTESGTIVSTGIEADIWDGFAARAGYNSMSGLWRDGSKTITAGAGYSFSEGIGGFDVSAGYQYWNDELDTYRDEMILYVSLWATERWLGD